MRRRAAALAAGLALFLCAAAPAQADFGFADFDVAATDPLGDPATLAGSHPEALRIEIGFTLGETDPGQPGVEFSAGDVKDLHIELPAGLIENPTAVPQCSQADFYTPRISPYVPNASGENCPDETQIGTIAIHTPTVTRHFGLFNLIPPPGRPSRFGAAPFGAPLFFTPRVRQAGGEYGLTWTSHNLPELFDVTGLDLEIWGAPWVSSHDGQRGDCLNEPDPTSPHAQCPIDFPRQRHTIWSYLTLPSDCAAPLGFSLAADRWQAPGAYLPSGEPNLAGANWKRASSVSPALRDCAALGFGFGASALPSTQLASSPTGLSFQLNTSLDGLLNPGGRLASRVKRAVVALPEGLTINPSVGAGLGACTPAQFAAESVSSAPGEGCPNPSKIGLVTLTTPLVEGTLEGSLFIAKPFDNPFGSPYALYFVTKSAERGFIVKVAGRLDANPATGRLTATFEGLPQLPYTNLKVNFREGQRAPLVSPANCATHTSKITLHPWIDPTTSLQNDSSFFITKGIGGGPCPTPGSEPFTPRAGAGTLNGNAGSYTPFYLRLTRSDAEQEITTYSTVLPPGLLGKIAGIPFCSDAAIEASKGRSGTAELEAPSCPGESQIGRTYSGYGVGLAPAYAPGRFYLAGPFHGAPLSVVAINSAIVGPFDLGTVVVRSGIDVDQRTAQVSIDSSHADPIPHIFAGIPLHLRDVRVYMDRFDFMVNPTRCDPFSIASTLTGSKAPFANPRDAFATASAPYQVSGCSGLDFSPNVGLRLRGPTKRGGHSELRVTVTPPPGQAGISSGAVTLPPSQFLDQDHIRTICTRAESVADACPEGSIVGHAVAQTPLMDEPLEGPVYLRSSSNTLPDLVAAIRGRGVRILLEGRIDTFRGGIRGTYEGLPDAPVTQFTMTIFGGRKRGILVNSENLCKAPQHAIARFIGHNNEGVALQPKVRTKCKKKKSANKHKRSAPARGRGK